MLSQLLGSHRDDFPFGGELLHVFLEPPFLLELSEAPPGTIGGEFVRFDVILVRSMPLHPTKVHSPNARRDGLYRGDVPI